MPVAAIVVVVPEAGALGFDGPFLPPVGRFLWTLGFGELVVELVDVVVLVDGDPVFALEVDVLAGGFVTLDVGVGVLDPWLPPWADVWPDRFVADPEDPVLTVAADASVWAGLVPADVEALFFASEPPQAVSPIATADPTARARHLAPTCAQRDA
jgi:hypothetical protein